MTNLGRRMSDDSSWATLRDRLFVLLALAAIIGFGIVSYFTIQTNRTVAEINQRQIEIVQQQNDVQICAQYEITVAVRKVALSLGLPVRDISLPDVGGLDCEAI